MRLKEYLEKNRWTITDFAKLVDYRREFISQLVNGRIKTCPRTARWIANHTDGEVTADEILSEYKPELDPSKNRKKNVAENSSK